MDIASAQDDRQHINAVDASDEVDEAMPTKRLDVANSTPIFSSLVKYYLCPCFSMILQNLEHALANHNSMGHLVASKEKTKKNEKEAEEIRKL